MGKVWRFTIENGSVKGEGKTRKQLTLSGCNEPFKDRYWCPKKQWFYKAPCPFVNQRDCENYRVMCGCL